MMETIRAIDPRQWMLVAIGLLLAITNSMTGMAFSYSLSEISAHFGESQYGAAVLLGARGMGGLPGLVFGIVFALLADRFGRKGWLAALALIAGASIIGISLVQSIKFAIGLAVLNGFVEGLLFALVIGMICETGNARGRYGATLLVSASTILTTLLGFGMAFLIGKLGWQIQLQVIATVMIAAGLVPLIYPSARPGAEAAPLKTSAIIGSLGQAIAPILLLALAVIVLSILSTGQQSWSSILIQQAAVAAGTPEAQTSMLMSGRGISGALGMAAMIAFLLTRPPTKVLVLTGFICALILVADLAGIGIWTKWPPAMMITYDFISGGAHPGVFALSFAALTSIVSPSAMTTAVYTISAFSRTFGALGTAGIAMAVTGQAEMSSTLIIVTLAIGIPAALIFGLALNRYAFRLSDDEILGEAERFS